jgi:flagellar motor switch/type III secretory pathway protein FliN
VFRVEIVDFSQVLQQSTSGRSLGDEILGSVVRAGIIAASLVQRDVRADATTLPAACQRWFSQPGNDNLVVGLTDDDAVAFTEVFFGGPAVVSSRPLAPVERRVLGTYLAIIVAPIASAVDRPIDPDNALAEAVEPPDNADWMRFGVSFAIDEAQLSCTIAVRDVRAAVGASASSSAPPQVEDIPVEAEVSLRNVRMAWGELASLRIGDVINCAVTEDQPIKAYIADRLAFEGRVTATDDAFVYEVLTTYLERSA